MLTNTKTIFEFVVDRWIKIENNDGGVFTTKFSSRTKRASQLRYFPKLPQTNQNYIQNNFWRYANFHRSS